MVCFEMQKCISFPNLESIALTSQEYLQPDQPGINDLLRKAAIAAMRMPKLQIMELWNCIDGHAAIFRYESTGTAESSASRITWRSSWDFPLEELRRNRVIMAWEKVALRNAGRELIVETDPLPFGAYSRYGAILRHLELRNMILDPISCMQVRVGLGEEDDVETKAWQPR